MSSAKNLTSACYGCEASSRQISKLTDDLNILEAQRDHYSSRCDELTTELASAAAQMNSIFKVSDCKPDESVFRSLSLESLYEWQQCLEFCIEQKREENAESETGKGGPLLPFSKRNLGWAGLLTRNHRLTQTDRKTEEYLEGKTKG